MRRGILFALALMITPDFGPVQAWTGSGCFCLSNPQHAYFLWGCREAKSDQPDLALCVDIAAAGLESVIVKLDENWTRVSEGEADCLPCQPPARFGLPETPRELKLEAFDPEPPQ